MPDKSEIPTSPSTTSLLSTILSTSITSGEPSERDPEAEEIYQRNFLILRVSFENLNP